jgi:hypothetical protein
MSEMRPSSRSANAKIVSKNLMDLSFMFSAEYEYKIFGYITAGYMK